MGSLSTTDGIRIRRATPADAVIAGPLCFEAFREIADYHRFPRDLPNAEFATMLFERAFSSSENYAVVAELKGEIVGSNIVDERGSIGGIGPLSVRSDLQGRAIGRRLMLDVMARIQLTGLAGARLVQAAFSRQSLSLYAKLGFDLREPLVCFQGTVSATPPRDDYDVRAGTAADLAACNDICRRIHAHDRAKEVADALRDGTLLVCMHSGELAAYATALHFTGHGVATDNDSLIAILATARRIADPGIILPARNSEVLRWCLSNGLRVTQPLNLMTMGFYAEPKGAFFPSVSY